MGSMKDLLGEAPYVEQPNHQKAVAQAIAAKQIGMAKADDGADDSWKEDMLQCVIDVARAKVTFTSDDIFDLAEARGVWSGTHDLRAFGPVMSRAARQGSCRKADRAPINSRRKSRHAAPLAVWESLLVGS